MGTDNTKEFRSLEEKLLLIQQERKKDGTLSIEEILQLLSGKGHPVVLILLSLPFCQPIQIPGLSTPFGLVIAFIGLRMTFGKTIWLPKRILKKTISNDVLDRIGKRALIFVRKMKPWIQPRFIWLSRSSFMEKGNGLMICMLGVLLALPLLVPMSNLTLAWSILLIAFGVLEDDGLFVLIGYLVFLLTLGFFFILVSGMKSLFSMYF